MIAGILTTPERQQYLPDLLRHVTPHARITVIFNDTEHRGHWWNSERAIREISRAARPSEPALLCDDDLLPVADWHDRWQRIHTEAAAGAYTMFGRKKHVFTPANLRRGWTYGAPYECWYGSAMILVDRPDLIDSVLAWYGNGGRDTMPKARQTHLDMVFAHYFQATGEGYVITTPSLFEHVGVKSTLGHSIGRSFCWAGDEQRLKELTE